MNSRDVFSGSHLQPGPAGEEGPRLEGRAVSEKTTLKARKGAIVMGTPVNPPFGLRF